MKFVHDSRLVAFKTLCDVFMNKHVFDRSLNKWSDHYFLDSRDRAFAQSLCGFVLRYRPSLQSAINRAAKRKRDPSPEHLNIILLMGLAQLQLMHVPDHAAIHSMVELADHNGLSKQKSLVNAVLRQLQETANLPKFKPSAPKWLYELWALDYGVETARAIALASMSEAPLSVTYKNTGENKPITSDQSVTDIEGFDEGEWWVQDFASHLPVTLLGDITGKSVLDLCSAPGGKTMQLASKGAKVTTVDKSSARLERLTENLTRTSLLSNVDVQCADLLKWSPDDEYDIVLLDAPCSATGTIRRHPDLPYLRTQKDIKSLASLQYDLLNRSKKWVKQGGVLVYCTCSLQKAEGENQINRFLDQNAQFKRVEINDYKGWQTLDGDIRLLPSYGDMDGFFISILELT
jgi:16S rRNA (cytosine967-C5)-methyltransferase